MRRERSDAGSEDGSVPSSKKSVRRVLEFPPPASNESGDKHDNASGVVHATNRVLENMASASADDAASIAPIIHNSSTSNRQEDQPISGHAFATGSSSLASGELNNATAALLAQYPLITVEGNAAFHNSQQHSTVLPPVLGVSIDQQGKQAVAADHDTFMKPPNTSGLLQDLNPGIIRQVRNSQRVLSVLHEFIEGTDSSSSVDHNRLGSGPSRVPSVRGQGGSGLDSSTADSVDNGNTKYGSSSNEDQNQSQK